MRLIWEDWMAKMVSICILNWNCLSELTQTIEKLNAINNLIYEIIIFDQNSNDGSVNFLNKIKNEKIKIIFSQSNIGNSISRNKMINEAKYDYVLLIDSDIVPIDNSIQEMLIFLENNKDFSFIGYDFHNYTKTKTNVTKIQTKITNEDIKIMDFDTDYENKNLCYCIPLCQYGLFRKEMLIRCPFPEFYPFNEEGWGSEDNVVGYAWKENQIGKGAIIKDRVYYHNKNSSGPLLGFDNMGRRYLIRYIYAKYFRNYLRKDQQLESLQNKTLPKIKLKLNKYHWKKQNNLGDLATDYVLKEFFPFFEFDETNKENLLMFGGTVFNHVDSANKEYNANFKNIIFFGSGLSCQEELEQAKKQFEKVSSLKIFPRGKKTETELKNGGVQCESPIGDVLQLFACFDYAHKKQKINKKCLCIKDSYSASQMNGTFPCDKIKVAQNDKNKMVPFVNLTNFLKLINSYEKVYSSQIHPFFIAAALGKPCHLFVKDWRAEDLCFFSKLKFDMSHQDCMELRKEIFKTSLRLVDQFMKTLKPYAEI